MSEAVLSQTGVLQGCQLSPLLFIIFINDLIEFLRIPDCDAPRVIDQVVHALLFADDLVLISHTVSGLQRLLDKLKTYCVNWNLEVNKEKTKVVVFKKGTKLAKLERWTYDDYNLEVVREFRYLGILFSSSGSWKKHIQAALRKARVNSMQTLKLSYRCSYLPLSLLLRVYDATVKSALLYGSEIWGIDADASLDASGTFYYKKLLRLPMSASNVGTHWYLYRDGINVSHRAEAMLRSFIYWFKLQLMEDNRLPKKCYLLQLTEMEAGTPCWASKIKKALEDIGLRDVWLNTPRNIKVFQARCFEKLVAIERLSLSDKAREYPSLNPLRVVKELAGRGAPIVCPTIQANPEKHRWVIITLLSCRGSLVRRCEGSTLCSACAEPVSDIFSHVLAFCKKTPLKSRRKQNLTHVIQNIQSDPESATPILLHQLFMSEDRFRLQRAYVELFLQTRL